MNRNQVLMAIGAVLLLGGVVGVARRSGIAEGKLQACNQFMGRLNAQYGQEVWVCEKQGGDVFITSPLAPGKKITLDGQLVE